MNEIKCPKCGTVFQIDEADYDSIVKQIRDKEFEKELEEREEHHKSDKENYIPNLLAKLIISFLEHIKYTKAITIKETIVFKITLESKVSILTILVNNTILEVIISQNDITK